jgi:hypothetical protein
VLLFRASTVLFRDTVAPLDGFVGMSRVSADRIRRVVGFFLKSPALLRGFVGMSKVSVARFRRVVEIF